MPERRHRPHKQSRGKAPPSAWSGLRTAAQSVGLRGQRQWPLVLHLAALSVQAKYRRGIFRGRRGLARELGLLTDAGELWARVDGRRVPAGVDRDQGGRNTRHRLGRLQALGLVRLATPTRIRLDGLLVGGGRLHGSTAAHFIGRAVRIYPGPQLAPKVLVDRWIRADDLVEAGLHVQAIDTIRAGRELSAGEVLQMDEAHRLLLRRATGADPP